MVNSVESINVYTERTQRLEHVLLPHQHSADQFGIVCDTNYWSNELEKRAIKQILNTEALESLTIASRDNDKILQRNHETR